MEQTKVYDSVEFNDALVLEVLKNVMDILKTRGYNPVNQIVGYLMSGDPGYITSYEGARGMITQFERSKLLEVLIKEVNP